MMPKRRFSPIIGGPRNPSYLSLVNRRSNSAARLFNSFGRSGLGGSESPSAPVRRGKYFQAPNSGEETHGVTMSTSFTTDEVMVVQRAILTGFYGEIDEKTRGSGAHLLASRAN